MKGFRVQALVVAAGVLLGLLMAGAGHGRQQAEIWTVLRCAGAVALVACAVAVVMLTVRAVSDRRVHRGKHDDYDEPPLPRYQPEPEEEEEEDVWAAIPVSRQAPALGLPGRPAPRPPVPAPAPLRTQAPAPEAEEVPR